MTAVADGAGVPGLPTLTQGVEVRWDDDTAGFVADDGESLLLAGLRHGWDLPYECASGGCGGCRARLVDGEVTSTWPDAPGLSPRDRRRGDRVLLCQSRPRGPVTLAPIGAAPVATDPRRPVPVRRPMTVAVLEALGRGSTRVVLEGEPLRYLPGQFAVVELPDGTRRAYSFSRPVEASGAARGWELLVRSVPGGAADAWWRGRLAPGDRVVVEGPFGRAHLQSDAGTEVVCVGGGSGLGPMLAIAEAAAASGHRVALYAGARDADDVVWPERLAALAGAGVDVHLGLDAGDPATLHAPSVQVRSGRVVDLLAADRAQGDLAGVDVYAAGPGPMVEALLSTFVRTALLSADRLFVDRFDA